MFLLLIVLLFIIILIISSTNNKTKFRKYNTNNSIDNVAIIIPIHPPYYHYIYHLIRKLNDSIDLILVFTNKDEYSEFKMKDKIKEIILENVSTERMQTYMKRYSITIFKKFYGLDNLKGNLKYDYFIVCDAEIDIIPENFNKSNIIQKINSIFNNKYVYGGYSKENENKRITYHTCTLFNNKNDIEKLKIITKDYSLYYWWNDLPVYKRTHLTEFFNIIKYDDVIWAHFEHIIYLNYLILYHNFKIINMNDILNTDKEIGIYECVSCTNINQILKYKEVKNSFSYIAYYLFKKFKNFFINEGTFILFHLDK